MPFINKIIGNFHYYTKNYDKAVHYLRKTIRTEMPEVFLSYSFKDKEVVLPFVAKALKASIPIYIDILDSPTKDHHSLEVGLSEALVNSKIVLAFISRNYLDSIWCRGELREFIFLHGRKLSLSEIEKLKESSGLALLSIEHQDHFVLPKMPIMIVLLDNTISEDFIAKAVSPESGISSSKWRDNINRAIVALGGGDLEKGEYEVALEYIKTRGIDASNYIKNIRIIPVKKYPIIKYREIVNIMTDLLNELTVNNENRTGPKDIIEIWEYIWSKYPYKIISNDTNPLSLITKINPYKTTKVVNDKIQKSIPDDVIYELFKAIATGKQYIEVFDRPSSEDYTPDLIENLISIIPFIKEDFIEFCKQLEYAKNFHRREVIRPIKKSGKPIDIMIYKSQNEDILTRMQQTYYDFNKIYGRNDLVDLVFIACCIINIDMAFEKMTESDQLDELIIIPLNEHKDIRSIFPFQFMNMKNALECEGLIKLHAELVMRQKESVRRHNILKKLT